MVETWMRVDTKQLLGIRMRQMFFVVTGVPGRIQLILDMFLMTLFFLFGPETDKSLLLSDMSCEYFKFLILVVYSLVEIWNVTTPYVLA